MRECLILATCYTNRGVPLFVDDLSTTLTHSQRVKLSLYCPGIVPVAGISDPLVLKNSITRQRATIGLGSLYNFNNSQTQ